MPGIVDRTVTAQWRWGTFFSHPRKYRKDYLWDRLQEDGRREHIEACCRAEAARAAKATDDSVAA